MFDSQIVLQTEREQFIHDHSSDFEIIIQLFPFFQLFFVSFQLIHLRCLHGTEKVEERFGFHTLCYDSLLSCFFIFLFLFNLFHGQIFSFPVNYTGLAFCGFIVFQEEFFSELFVRDELIFTHFENDGEVVCAFFIHYVNIFDGLQQGFIFRSHCVLYNSRIAQHFKPVIRNSSCFHVF